METATLSSQLAQQFADTACSAPQQLATLVTGVKELAGCSAFKRAAFLTALSHLTEQLQPPQLVQLITTLHQAGLFCAQQLLHTLLPDPQHAAGMLQKAACSQAVCLALIGSSNAQLQAHTAAQVLHSAAELEAILQLLQALLTSVFDAAAVLAAESTAATHTAAALAPCCDSDMQQYVTAVLQHLQDAANQHEVLALCLLQAAVRANIVCDSGIVTSWAAAHLRRNLTAKLPTAQPAQSHAATPPAAAQSLAVSTWPCLALQHSGLIIPAALQCIQWDGVLEVVLTSEALVTAAGSVTGLACMCEMLAALTAAGCTYAVVEALAHSLAAALQGGNTRSSLAHLLVAGHMLAISAWNPAEYAAVLQQAGAACQEGHSGTVVSGLLKTFNLLLPTSSSTALQAQVECLQRLRPQLGPVLQGEVSSTEGTLRDVLAQQQQMSRQEQQAKQGGKPVGRDHYDGYNQFLDQYMQLPPLDAQGRRLGQVLVARWKLMNAAPAFCEAFTQQPPNTLDRAQACLAYMQELQMHKLCKPEHVEAFRASCLAYGLDLAAPPGSARMAPSASADPVTNLQSMLERLPVVLAAGSRPGLTTLLTRITQQVKELLQPAQYQQQRQQEVVSHGSRTSEPALKRHRSAEAAVSSTSGTSIDPHELLDMLLAAYAAATGSSAAWQDAGWAWRLEYLAMLQELLPLHAPLLERLLGALCGSATAADGAPQQALWHGSLLACLSAARLQPTPILGPQAEGAVTTEPVARPLFTWQGGSGRQSSKGCELVQLLVSCTSVQTAHARCCAASFWVGYVGCIKTAMKQWCAAPHGPFGNAATAGISPGTLTALTQQQARQIYTAAEQQQQQQQQQGELVAYVPPQLVSLLRELVSSLTSDMQMATAGAGDLDGEGYDAAVVGSALQVCTRALRAQAAKWVCQVYGV